MAYTVVVVVGRVEPYKAEVEEDIRVDKVEGLHNKKVYKLVHMLKRMVNDK